ncbi:TauD/TfdA dioxygenase family protein [Sphingobium sp.]|uniref:TauD/TfdA dioxygenase family protein n=1 Tax=Sphingobium sp. TaxID=1912891 RepID=UPI003B3AD7E2
MSDTVATYLNMPDPANPLDVAPVGGTLGAEIRGVAVQDADDATLDHIRAAIVRHKVVFFRKQQMDDQGHEAFAKRLGRSDTASKSRGLIELNSSDGYAANIWHTDQTYAVAPPDMTMLRSVVSPVAGGDTLWANTAAAYANLPAPLKALVDGLWGIHNNSFDYAQVFGKEVDAADEKWQKSHRPNVVESQHPVVRIHPESGERTLVAGFYMQRFYGMNGSDSRHLMSIIQDHITVPENTVRWRWEPGDIVIWDNRATQHRAITDFGTQLRVMKRAVIGGTSVVGIDGQQSKAIKAADAVRAA